jgi:uncharacterized phage protein (TIGR02218 family)
MSFDAFEISTRSGKPIFLMRFVAGTQVYNYTTDQEPHTYLSETYDPMPGLLPSGTGQSQEVNAQRVTLTASKDWIIPRLFVAFVPSQQMFLTVFKFHRDDPASVYVYWQGFVRSAKFDERVAKIDCDPITVLLDRLGLRRTFQGLCNHMLYDGFCPVPPSAFKVDGVLGSKGTFTITAPEWASQPNGWFTAGFIERTLLTGVTDMRFITGHTTDTLTLLSPFPDDLAVGEILHAYAGCDHIFSTCAGKFGAYTDTGGAYGGFDRVPKKNLFKTGVDNAS